MPEKFDGTDFNKLFIGLTYFFDSNLHFHLIKMKEDSCKMHNSFLFFHGNLLNSKVI